MASLRRRSWLWAAVQTALGLRPASGLVGAGRAPGPASGVVPPEGWLFDLGVHGHWRVRPGGTIEPVHRHDVPAIVAAPQPLPLSTEVVRYQNRSHIYRIWREPDVRHYRLCPMCTALPADPGRLVCVRVAPADLEEAKARLYATEFAGDELLRTGAPGGAQHTALHASSPSHDRESDAAFKTDPRLGRSGTSP